MTKTHSPPHNTPLLRLAHISDLHFSHLSFYPSQIFNKRWLGTVNLLLFRKQMRQPQPLQELLHCLNDMTVNAVCITGDFSSLSLDKEFAQGKSFVKTLLHPVLFVPGNHDCYTPSIEKRQRFYDFFPSNDLKFCKVEVKPLTKHWWWVGLDCTLATPIFYSYGRFGTNLQAELQKALASIPKTDHIIVGNHFPLFPSSQPKHDLQQANNLQNLLKQYPNVRLYIHGHEHSCYIKQDPANELPLICNSGSVAGKEQRTFHVYDLYEQKTVVTQFVFKPTPSGLSEAWQNVDCQQFNAQSQKQKLSSLH